MKYVTLAVLVLVLFVAGAWWSSSLSSKNEMGIVVSTEGIHWHPELEIYIHGEKQVIPENLGLNTAIHSPIHTHEDLPIIHLEFSGKVTEDDIRLGNFFSVWNKAFGPGVLFEYQDGPDGVVTMYVNGEENNEFGDYIMRHEDKIVIRYE